MQILEHQCLLAIRQKNYEDTIECDACHRVIGRLNLNENLIVDLVG